RHAMVAGAAAGSVRCVPAWLAAARGDAWFSDQVGSGQFLHRRLAAVAVAALSLLSPDTPHASHRREPDQSGAGSGIQLSDRRADRRHVAGAPVRAQHDAQPRRTDAVGARLLLLLRLAREGAGPARSALAPAASVALASAGRG